MSTIFKNTGLNRKLPANSYYDVYALLHISDYSTKMIMTVKLETNTIYNTYVFDSMPWYYKLYQIGCKAFDIPCYYTSSTTWHASNDVIPPQYIPHKVIYSKQCVSFINKLAYVYMQFNRGHILDKHISESHCQTDLNDWVLCTLIDHENIRHTKCYHYFPDPLYQNTLDIQLLPSPQQIPNILDMPNEILRVIIKKGNWDWSTYRKLAMAQPWNFRKIMLRLVSLSSNKYDVVAILDSIPLYNMINIHSYDQDNLYSSTSSDNEELDYIKFYNDTIQIDIQLGIIVAIAATSNSNKLRNNVFMWDVATGCCLSQIKYRQQYLQQYALCKATYIYNPNNPRFINPSLANIKRYTKNNGVHDRKHMNNSNYMYINYMKIRRFIKTHCKGVNKTQCWLIVLKQYITESMCTRTFTYQSDNCNNNHDITDKYTIVLQPVTPIIDQHSHSNYLNNDHSGDHEFVINMHQFEYMKKLMQNINPDTFIPIYCKTKINTDTTKSFVISLNTPSSSKTYTNYWNNLAKYCNNQAIYKRWSRQGYTLPIYGI